MTDQQARALCIRLGHLHAHDFLRFDRRTATRLASDPVSLPLLEPAFAFLPHVVARLSRLNATLAERLEPKTEVTLEQARSARDTLARRWCMELLRAKSPAMHDTMPWHDWDFGWLTARFRLWRTRMLACGEGTALLVGKCRRTAGICVVEPVERVAGYIETRGRLEKTRGLEVRRDRPERLDLPDSGFDLAVAGLPLYAEVEPTLRELCRVARSVVLLGLGPANGLPKPELLAELRFREEAVELTVLREKRPLWLRTA